MFQKHYGKMSLNMKDVFIGEDEEPYIALDYILFKMRDHFEYNSK